MFLVYLNSKQNFRSIVLAFSKILVYFCLFKNIFYIKIKLHRLIKIFVIQSCLTFCVIYLFDTNFLLVINIKYEITAEAIPHKEIYILVTTVKDVAFYNNK